MGCHQVQVVRPCCLNQKCCLALLDPLDATAERERERERETEMAVATPSHSGLAERSERCADVAVERLAVPSTV